MRSLGGGGEAAGRSGKADPCAWATGGAPLTVALTESFPRLLVAVVAGAGLHLAYPWPGWDLLGWVGLAPVLALAATARSPRRAALEGGLAGIAFYMLLLRWLIQTMTTFSTLSTPLAVLVLLGLAGYLALYWSAVAAAIAWLGQRLGATALWLAAPLWVAGELLRTYLLSGFPWGLLGYVPYRRLALIQIAAWTGVYGVSFLVVLVNTGVAWWLVRRRAVAAVPGAAIVAGSLGVTLALGLVSGRDAGGGTVPVALVQGNIPQTLKWDQAQQQAILETYAELTRGAASGSRLVVWPEAAVPAYVRLEPRVSEWLTRLAAEVDRPLLVGAPDASRDGQTTRYLNSALLVQAKGVQGRYDKIHLVPFGEYVPLKGLLFFVEAIAAEVGEFTPGRERVVFPLPEAPFGTVICYEVIFPDLFRRFVRDGARFMVNITNDAWFGDSGGPLQHLATVPLRAVENGVAIARAANTGVSALVDPSGRIDPELGLFRRGALRVDVPLRTRETFYTRFGDVFAYVCSTVAAAALAARAAAGRRGD